MNQNSQNDNFISLTKLHFEQTVSSSVSSCFLILLLNKQIDNKPLGYIVINYHVRCGMLE